MSEGKEESLEVQVAKLRGSVIELAGVTIQIYAVLAALHPRGSDERSKAVELEMKTLLDRIQNTLNDLKG